ncbi:MAG: ribulose-phosphate 3-epimerase [Parcubacteria group bacterium Gr01-1014_29]|nr:MAG: ribulose-phosphate 3-epimerase [Parcubacteria group bacterium Gr01-1014_29]
MREVEIIPSINAETFAEVQKKIRLVEPYVSWVHLDVADGSFTDITLWHNPDDLLEFQTPLFIEVHLMLDRIDERADEWLKPNVRRLIFHREASRDPDTVIEACRRADIQPGIAIRPDTPVEDVFPYLAKIDLVQTLAVVPGRAGQKFIPETLSKISALRYACSACRVEVDGGIDTNTALQVVRAGADTLVVASAIFNTSDIKKAVEELRSHANI